MVFQLKVHLLTNISAKNIPFKKVCKNLTTYFEAMKYYSFFLFILSIIQVSCNEQAHNDARVLNKNARIASEIDLLTYSIPPHEGKPVSVGALMDLKSRGLPMLESDIEIEKAKKTWQQMDSLFVAVYPTITDPQTRFVWEEHMAQVILKDFKLLLSTEVKALEKIAFYTDILHRNQGVHAGHLYLALTKLKGFWSEQKIREYSQTALKRVNVMLTQSEEKVLLMKQNAEKNLQNLSVQERKEAEKSLGRIFKMYDEHIYFSTKLKTLSQD